MYSTSWVMFTVPPWLRAPVVVSWAESPTFKKFSSAVTCSTVMEPLAVKVASSPVAVDDTPSRASCAVMVATPKLERARIRLRLPSALGALAAAGLLETQVTSWVTLIDRPWASEPIAVNENARPYSRAICGGWIWMRVSGPTTVSVALPPESSLETPLAGSTALIVVVPAPTASMRLLMPKTLGATATPGLLEWYSSNCVPFSTAPPT